MKTLAILLLTAALLSCAGIQPQLSTLYKTSGEATAQPPVILVHGAFGGRLCDNDGKEH